MKSTDGKTGNDAEQVNQAETALALVTGADISSTLAQLRPLERIQFLKKISEYVGAETEDVNKLLNVPIEVTGVLLHQATINKGDFLDPVSGELSPMYVNAERTVFKLKDGKVLGFVALSVANYVKDFIIPAFGVGDWHDEEGKPLSVTIKITQITAKGGRAYSIQVLG